MAEIYHSDKNEKGEDVIQKVYWDRKFYNSLDEHIAALQGSTTLYVGNVSNQTTEQQLYEFFSRAGPVNRVIMGLNRETREPCGFCFVEYFSPEHAGIALKFLNQTCCDGNMDVRAMDSESDIGRVRLEVSFRYASHYIFILFFVLLQLLPHFAFIHIARWRL